MANHTVIEELQSRIAAMESNSPLPENAKKKQKAGLGENSDNRPNDALKKIIALVNVSDRSQRGIRDRLARDGFTEPDIETAVEQAKQYGIIDDKRFAEVLVRSRISQGKGSSGIVRELAENDIDANDVPGWPYEFPLSSDEEIERAIEVLMRKPPRAKNKRDAAYRKLMQKGYPSAVASSAARMWHESIQGARNV